MILKTLLTAGLLTSAAASVAHAKAAKFEGAPAELASAENLPYEDKAYQAELTAATKRAARAVASDSNFEAAMSPQLKALRAEILAVRSAGDLDKALKTLAGSMDALDKQDTEKGITASNRYAGPDRDFRYFATQILPLQCLRGVIWRFTPLAEKSSVVESRLVTQVRRMAESMQIAVPQVDDLPNNEARTKAKENNEQNIAAAVFDYLTLPYEGAVLFGEGYDLQAHLMNSCYPELWKSSERLGRLDLSTPIVWDNKMYFGVGTFPDDLDRYKLVGEAERHASLAGGNAGMHFISVFRSYNIKNYFSLQTELNKLYVADAFPQLFTRDGFAGIDGITVEKRAATIRKFAETFTIYEDGADIMRKRAWPHLVRSVQEFNLAWAELKDKPENQRTVLNPAYFNAARRDIGQVLATWSRLTAGPAQLHSRLSERTVTYDLKGFYAHPVADLKTFLPTRFDQMGAKYVAHTEKTLMAAGRGTPTAAASKYSKHRNWYYGQPTGWNLSAWKSLYPEVSSDADLLQSVRTTRQAWGGAALALPLMPFLR